MAVSEQQLLGIDKYEGQCGTGASWLWEILAGGGSLSDPTSSSGCTYTAPASNEGCEQNPTISLSCDGVVMDTLDIAVTGTTGGYWTPIARVYYAASTGYRSPWYSNCDVDNMCNMDGDLPTIPFAHYDCYGQNATLHSCGKETVCCQSEQPTWQMYCSGASPNSVVDLRSPTDLSNGCCPEQLL
jgi:hypothetical protein